MEELKLHCNTISQPDTLAVYKATKYTAYVIAQSI